MPMHVNPNAVLIILAMHLVLTASIITPEASLELFLKLLGLPGRYRERRLEKKSRQLEEKLKKCWLIDLRKTH
jgi:hypothetical protein